MTDKYDSYTLGDLIRDYHNSIKNNPQPIAYADLREDELEDLLVDMIDNEAPEEEIKKVQDELESRLC